MNQSAKDLSRPSLLTIRLDAIGHNLRAIRSHIGETKIMAVVKANAYGHGLIPVAQVLSEEGVNAFGVALVEEAIQLRENGIKEPILVFGGILGKQIQPFLLHDIDLTCSSLSKLSAISKAAKNFGKVARVHLKIDSGMERIGVHWYNAREFLEKAFQDPWVRVVGVYSHLACSEDSDTSFTRQQIARFSEAIQAIPDTNQKEVQIHIANSAAMLRFPESYFDMVRVGASLYGIPPARNFQSDLGLKPALELRSQVVFFKVVRKGAGVSYGQLWHAPDDTRVVTIPVGYGDGYPRGLSDKGEVLIRGKRYPIRGRVCMDQFMVDIGPEGTAYTGDEVVLIGSQGEEQIETLDLAEMLDTDPREVLTTLNLRVPREYIR